MTRSRRPPAKRPRASEAPAKRPRASEAPDRPTATEPATRLPRRRTVLVDLAIMIGAFTAASGGAELAGAANLGTALSFGQIAFALAAFYVFMRR